MRDEGCDDVTLIVRAATDGANLRLVVVHRPVSGAIQRQFACIQTERSKGLRSAFFILLCDFAFGSRLYSVLFASELRE